MQVACIQRLRQSQEAQVGFRADAHPANEGSLPVIMQDEGMNKE
jgi:hypothetical protein